MAAARIARSPLGYRGAHLPEEGEIIDVVRFLRGRVIRARVTRVDVSFDPTRIAATQID